MAKKAMMQRNASLVVTQDDQRVTMQFFTPNGTRLGFILDDHPEYFCVFEDGSSASGDIEFTHNFSSCLKRFALEHE